MDEKDIIVRISGDYGKAREAFSEIFEKAEELNLIGEDLSIHQVPSKVEKNKLQNKMSSDIMVRVSSSENSIESFMEEVVQIISESLHLDSPSTSIKLLAKNNDEDSK